MNSFSRLSRHALIGLAVLFTTGRVLAQTSIPIASANDLQGIQNNLSGTYVLVSDVSLTSAFTPLGGAGSPFTGSFDGRGHTITGLTLSTSSGNAGLFAQIGAGGKVSRLRITGANLQGNGSTGTIGVLAGVSSGIISQVYVEGAITTAAGGQALDEGGLVGRNVGQITNAASGVNVSASNTNYLHLGGLAGFNGGAISGSTASGAVAAANGNNNNGQYTLGGLVGSNTGSTTRSSAIGAVVGNNAGGAAGGLAGYNSGSINSSYARGSVDTISINGGLVGWNQGGTIADAYAAGLVTGTAGGNAGGLVELDDLGGSITRSYAVGGVSGSGVGGLVDRIGYGGGSVMASYWDIQTSGTSASAGGTGLTTAQLQATTLPSGFGSAWITGPTWASAIGKYPQLWQVPLALVAFPIPGKTPYTVGIISVVDHSLVNSAGQVQSYSCENGAEAQVVGFTGAVGRAVYGSYGKTAGDTNCSDHLGYNQESEQAFDFSPVANYVGASGFGGALVLNYNGHDGIDFSTVPVGSTTSGPVQVLAAVSGVVYYPLSVTGLSSKPLVARTQYHVMGIKPDGVDTFRLLYLHLTTEGGVPCLNSLCTTKFTAVPGCYATPSGLPVTSLPLPDGTHVKAGCVVAVSGKAGPAGTPYHLHLGVQQIFPATQAPTTAAVGTAMTCYDESKGYAKDSAGHHCLPLDAFGWLGPATNCAASPPVGDVFECLTGIPSRNFWFQ
ncbi:MAG TPA: hypothetical protein VFA75_00405 [Nevskia sp.]|nr:hypothetical protein [Nevskia sp.]